MAYQFWNMSPGGASGTGRWAKGPTPDGKGEFSYLERPQPMGPVAEPPPGDPRTFGTPDSNLLKKVVKKVTQ